MQSTTGIHCKVQYGNEYRRFLYQSTQYAQFLDQIKRLFGFYDSDEVLLKYKDDDGDMVTVSSNEELRFAIELFTGSVIRFTVTKEENRKRPARRLQKEGECARPNKKNGEFWRERWNQKIHDNPELLAKKIDKLTQKRDWIRSRLDANQHNGRPNRMNIEKKLERIEACLSKLTTFSTNQNPPTEPSQCPNPGRTEQTNVVVVSVPQTTPLPLNVDEIAINLAKAKELREQ